MRVKSNRDGPRTEGLLSYLIERVGGKTLDKLIRARLVEHEASFKTMWLEMCVWLEGVG